MSGRLNVLKGSNITTVFSKADGHSDLSTQRWLRFGWLWLGLLICGLIGVVVQQSVAQQESDAGLVSREHPLKALFTYNFGGYVEWPSGTFANEQAPFMIGILGSTPIEETLRQIAATKKIGEHPIVIKKFDAMKEIHDCQILFVPRTTPQPIQSAVLEALKNQPVLIVGESSGFAIEGATINFFIEANKIRFEINTVAAKRQQLKVSSKLLAMAKIISNDASSQAMR